MTTATRTNPLSYLTDQLNELKAKGTHFKLRVLDDEQAAVCTFDGKKVINLASNNYLGFRTGLMLPLVSREPSIWDVWILNAWMVLTGTVEFALLGFLLRFAIRDSAILSSAEPDPTYGQGINCFVLYPRNPR